MPEKDPPGPGLLDGDSLPALSVEADPDTPSSPLARPEALRYRAEHVLGWGGMGKVEAATDQRLGREVAIKTAAPGSRAEARLAQEARITARLEHPGIVPVYDAGLDAEGRPWYAMRLVRGQTLEDAIRDGKTEQRRLVRHFLAACEAVGYAHHEGVIHRDLKPGNILIGAFGETQVADWGLARPLEAASVQGQVHTVEGSVIGTPAYMSPEQAAGRETDRRSDVWSLGATLFELLSGKPPYAGEPDAVLRQLVTQPPPQLVDPDLPAALVAIVRRAMQPAHDARYASAREMAEDVERWLTGERVQAHRYTSGELLVRFVVARRAAVAVAAGAAVLLLLGAARLVQERDRARSAEQVAEAARAASDGYLAQALIAQALAAQREGAQPKAEVLAAAALRILPTDPRARGILSAFSATDSPRLEAVVPLPGCDSADVSPDGLGYACRSAEVLTFFDRAGDGFQQRWSRRSEEGTVRFTHPQRVVVYRTAGAAARLDAADGALLDWISHAGNASWPVPSGPDEILWWSGNNGIMRTVSPRVEQAHWSRRIAAMARLPDGPILLAGVAGGLYAFYSEEDVRFIGQTALISEHQAARMWHDGGMLVLAGLRGQAAVVSLETGLPLLQVRGQGGNVIDARLSPDHSLLAIAGERGSVEVFRVDTGARIAQLPGAGVWAMRFRADSRTLETYSDQLHRWKLPEHSRPRRWHADGGITTVSASGDGRHLAASTGTGTIWLWDRRSGAVRHTFELGAYVIKAVDFTGDSQQLVFTDPSGNGVRFGSVSTGELLGSRLDAQALRRLCWASGLLVSTSYGLGPHVYDTREERYRSDLIQPRATMTDLCCASDGQVAVMSDGDGGIWRLDAARPATMRWLAEPGPAGQVAVDTRSPRRVAVATGAAVTLLDASTGERRATLPPPGQRIFDLAFSPDGSLLAGGLLDGSIVVWDTDAGVVRARLENHQQRVSSLAFTPDGTGLLSASWDGDVRLWGVEVLWEPAEELAARIEQRWGLSLEEALKRAPIAP